MDLFTPPDPDGAWLIERVPLDGCAERIGAWKGLLTDGWELTVLVDYRRGELVALGCRPYGHHRAPPRLRP